MVFWDLSLVQHIKLDIDDDDFVVVAFDLIGIVLLFYTLYYYP